MQESKARVRVIEGEDWLHDAMRKVGIQNALAQEIQSDLDAASEHGEGPKTAQQLNNRQSILTGYLTTLKFVHKEIENQEAHVQRIQEIVKDQREAWLSAIASRRVAEKAESVARKAARRKRARRSERFLEDWFVARLYVRNRY